MESILALGPVAVTVTEIGSYAGFAAILGLAVLSALYFSQARDVRRLRDWAGRAPERDAEARSRVAAATAAGQARQGVAAVPQAAQPATPQTAQPAAQSAAGAVAAPAKAPAVPAAAAAARPVGRPSSPTSILGSQEPPRAPWYRRIAPRYIALIVAGVLVVGGGIAVGVVQLMSGDDGGGGAQTNEQAAVEGQSPTAPLQPADVSVAVLNATGVPGLANQFGDKAQAEGFTKDNVGNANGGQRAESVVMYAPGREDAARLVRRRLDVSNIEPVDPESQRLAPDADVILVIGSDKTQ